MQVAINADMGESFGHYQIGNDDALMQYLSSVNLACGFHAGDPVVMRHSVETAAKYGVSIGAHPGFQDKQGFGRRMLDVSENDLYCDLIYQFGALDAFVKCKGPADDPRLSPRRDGLPGIGHGDLLRRVYAGGKGLPT